MRSIAVYCSSSDRLPQVTLDLAHDLGRLLGVRGIRLVYGGGARGLMGVVARAAHAAGGAVDGFMLQTLREREGANEAIGTLHFVATLDERKRQIAAGADAVIALPGGIGTLDELTEVLTRSDIGVSATPVCLCDADGFWEPFVEMIARFDAYGVMRAGARRDLIHARGAAAALDACAAALATRSQANSTPALVA